MDSSLASHDVVLVGAGHTNMHVVRMWRMSPVPGAQLTLVSPYSRAAYSGMLPGTLAGQYDVDDMEIDLYRFTAGTGIRLIVAPAVGLDPQRRRVLLEDRPPIRYDVASIGIGSVPACRALWTSNDRVLAIKPMATFLPRFESKLQEIQQENRPNLRIGVVGGGAAGTEIAFCLRAYLSRRGTSASVALIEAGGGILAGCADKTIAIALRELAKRDIQIHTDAQVVGWQDNQATLANDSTIDVDLLIWAIPASPPPELDGFLLPKADDGFLAVRPTLQTTAEHRVFAVGDTGTIVDNPIRKAGVYAVREGPILWKNIQRALRDEPLLRYDPQGDFLSLLSTGDGKGVLQYHGFSAYGKWVWRLKDLIDRRFMRMYQEYGMTMEPPISNADDKPVMKCRGCGGKVGSHVLSAALERLDIPVRGTRQGLHDPDDAAILDPTSGTAEVISVDFFQSFMDDPYLVGRVAALNSLSDLWATGAHPLGAMAMVTIPQGEPRQQSELLYQVLAGGLREIDAAGGTLWGGHTTESAELTIGYTVIGDLRGQMPLIKAGLQPGQQLILAKPLGTGFLLAAHMEGLARGTWMDQLITSMVTSNRIAADVAREAESPAVTDVTGFGLAGHLFEMLDASQHHARVELGAIPLYDGVDELIGRGIRSTLYPANASVADRIEAEANLKNSAGYHSLFDPQTSGGLLIAVQSNQVDSALASLRDAGYPMAARIGEVTDATSQPRLTLN